MKTDEGPVKQFVVEGAKAVPNQRLRTMVAFALKLNQDAAAVSDQEIVQLQKAGLTDKGIVQLRHLVSDFASYSRLNLALQTDYDYRDMWRQLAFENKSPLRSRYLNCLLLTPVEMTTAGVNGLDNQFVWLLNCQLISSLSGAMPISAKQS